MTNRIFSVERRGGANLVRYVCIVFGPQSRVLRTESFEARGDGDACTRAITIQRAGDGDSYELWRAGRKISAFYGRKPGRPWLTNPR